MFAAVISVLPCAICGKPCPRVEILFDPNRQQFDIKAECHGDTDTHTISMQELGMKKFGLRLRPFVKKKP